MRLFQRFRLGVQPRALLTAVSVGSVISKAYGRTTQADMLDEVVSIRQSTFLSSDAFCVPEAVSPRKARILREGLGLSAVPIMDITGSTWWAIRRPTTTLRQNTTSPWCLTGLYSEHWKRLTVAITNEPDFSEKFQMFIKTSLPSIGEHPHAMIFTTGNLAVPGLMCVQMGKIKLLLRLDGIS
jgi:hypothetical protein